MQPKLHSGVPSPRCCDTVFVTPHVNFVAPVTISMRGSRKDLPSADNTEPGLRLHPEVLAVMQEVGIDLSNAKPQKLTEELAKEASLLITMGCGDKCPYVPGLRRDDWPLRDPKGLPMDQVRLIRDEIKERVRTLLKSESFVCG